MKIIIKKGEPLWSEEGFHVLDENGFAVVNEELHKEIYITNPDAIERVKKSLPRERWDEVYQLAIDSTQMFLKDKDIELLQFQQEQNELPQKNVQLENEKLRQQMAERENQLRIEKEKFDSEQKALRDAREAELRDVIKQKQEEEAAAVAKSEAEMAEVKKRSDILNNERKKREAEEAAAEAAAKKAQEELIADLLQRIKNLEKNK